MVSAQNVFVLIASGKKRNAAADRTHVRDSNHVADSSGQNWLLNVDNVIFSSTQNIDGADAVNDGDDTVVVMSFFNFKSEVNRHGVNLERISDSVC